MNASCTQTSLQQFEYYRQCSLFEMTFTAHLMRLQHIQKRNSHVSARAKCRSAREKDSYSMGWEIHRTRSMCANVLNLRSDGKRLDDKAISVLLSLQPCDNRKYYLTFPSTGCASLLYHSSFFYLFFFLSKHPIFDFLKFTTPISTPKPSKKNLFYCQDGTSRRRRFKHG